MDPYEGESFTANDWVSPNGYADPGQMQGFEEEDYKRQGGPPRKRSRHTRTQGEFGRGHHVGGGHHHSGAPAASGGPRRGPPPTGKEVDEIAEFLSFLCSNSGSQGISDMVVEARLGKFSDVEEGAAEEDEPKERQFSKEVKKEDFFHILNFLEDDHDKERSVHERTVFKVEDTRGNAHLTFDSQTSDCVDARYTNREFNLDLVTPFLPYDCRINVCAYEVAPLPKEMPSDYKRKQKIKRWTFYKQRNIWRIDLLEVHSFYTSPRGQRKSLSEDGEMDTSEKEKQEEEEEEECNEEGLFPDKRNPIYYIHVRLMQDVLQSLSHTDRSNLQYIAGKFWQTIQFFAGKSAGTRARRPFPPGGATGGFNNIPYNQHLAPGTTGGPSHHYHHGGGGGSGGTNGRSPYHRTGAPSLSPSNSRSPSLSPSLSPFFSPQQWSASPSPHAPASSATPPSPLSQIPSTFPEVQLQLVEHQMNDSLRRLCMKLVKGGQEISPGTNISFPGALPINFGRRYWKLVQSKEYYVSEKTDGMRYMMLVTKSGVYLTDRSFEFYSVQGFEQLVKLYASQGDTLLDGEMVSHQTTHRATYLVFDVLFINGVYYGDKDLSVRLQKLRDLIIVPYRKATERGQIDKNNHPFIIIGKQFFDKKYTKKVFEHIKKEKRGGEEAYYYHDEKRHHKTDGLIFTPDEPYVPFSNSRLFKWKYLEKNTIDFKIVPVHGRDSRTGESYLLTCRGRNDQGDIECDVAQFVPEDIVKLKLDLQQAGQSLENLTPDANVIVECCYDTKQGQWRYCCYRPEKHQANYIKVVFSTLLSMAENVGKEEIMYRILRTAKNDDWEKQHHLVMHQQQQKKRPSSAMLPVKKESHNNNNNNNHHADSKGVRTTMNGGEVAVKIERGEGSVTMKDSGELSLSKGREVDQIFDGELDGGVKEEVMKEEEEDSNDHDFSALMMLPMVKDEQDQEKIEDAKMEDMVMEGGEQMV